MSKSKGTSFWCKLFGHKYKKELIGELSKVFGNWMKGDKDNLKVITRGGLTLAYEEICERCRKEKDE